MSAQTSYTINQAIAYAGLVYAQAPHDIVSRDVETAAGIAFGVAVSRGTDKNRQAVIGGTDYLGVTVRSLEREGDSASAIEYAQKETAAILREGYIYAVCPTGCVAGAAVLYNNTTGVLDAGSAGGGETQLNGSSWESSVAAGELGIIRLNDAEVNVNANVTQIINAQVTVANSGTPDGLANVTVQLLDGYGTAVTSAQMIETWWSVSAEYGAPADIGDEALVTGTEIQEILDHAHYKFMSDATGLVEFTVDMDTPAEIWFMVSIDGKVFTGTATITA